MYQAKNFLLAFSCLPLVFCRYTETLPIEESGPYDEAIVQEYNPDIGQTNVGGYGVNKDPYCHKVEKVVFENQCEPYTEKTCWTQNKEHCEGKMFKNCTGVRQMWSESVSM